MTETDQNEKINYILNDIGEQIRDAWEKSNKNYNKPDFRDWIANQIINNSIWNEIDCVHLDENKIIISDQFMEYLDDEIAVLPFICNDIKMETEYDLIAFNDRIGMVSFNQICDEESGKFSINAQFKPFKPVERLYMEIQL